MNGAPFEDKLRELPLTNKKARDFKRFFLGSAVDGELDKQGRVLISSALRAYAGLEKEVVLAGVLDKIEIWDKKAWDAHNEEVEADIDDIRRRHGRSGPSHLGVAGEGGNHGI